MAKAKNAPAKVPATRKNVAATPDKATAPATVVTAPKAAPDVKATKAEMTPAERFAADIARRNGTGTLTNGQKTFLENKAFQAATAGMRLNLTAATVVALLKAPHSLDSATLASLAVEADKVRGLTHKTPYFTKRATARFAFNEGAPRMTWTDAEPIVAKTVADVYKAKTS